MHVHLVDGTYELFRCYYGAPSAQTKKRREVGATRGLLRSLASWLRTGEVTHVAYAFDHVIESFRNDLFSGYKTGEGMDPDLFKQFDLAERAVRAMGIVVWPMVEFEADDAIATAALRYANDKQVHQIRLCTPDKDLTQCVSGQKIVLWDRFNKVELDEVGVKGKFGVPPSSIPDLLALVGDTADGIPGIERWGMKSASTVLAAYGTLEKIPTDSSTWKSAVRGATALAKTLRDGKADAALYKKLATLRDDVPLTETVKDLEWQGADREAIAAICEEIEDPGLLERIEKWRS